MFFFTLPALSLAGIQWQPVWHLSANGQPMSVEVFSSDLPPDRMVQMLVARNPAYERFLVGEGRLLLSGVSEGVHWLAEVQGHARGSQGYVSALYFDPARARPSLLLAGQTRAAVTRAGASLGGLAGSPVLQYEFDSGAWLGLFNDPSVSGQLLLDSDTHTAGPNLLGAEGPVLFRRTPSAPMAVAVSLPEQ